MSFRNQDSLNDIKIKELEHKMTNDMFRLRIRTKDNYSVEELEKYGVYVSGIREIDKAAGNEFIYIMLSIEHMLEYLERGSIFYIPSQDDIVKIYDIVQSYLVLWKTKLSESKHNEKHPSDKLLKYNQFADLLYQYSKHNTGTPREFSSKFLSSLNVNSLFSSELNLRRVSFVPEEDKGKDEPPERESLDTFFKSRKIPKRPRFR